MIFFQTFYLKTKSAILMLSPFSSPSSSSSSLLFSADGSAFPRAAGQALTWASTWWTCPSRRTARWSWRSLWIITTAPTARRSWTSSTWSSPTPGDPRRKWKWNQAWSRFVVAICIVFRCCSQPSDRCSHHLFNSQPWVESNLISI